MSNEDVILWPCGEWCYRTELSEMLTFMSDDYEVIQFDTPEYWAFMEQQT